MGEFLVPKFGGKRESVEVCIPELISNRTRPDGTGEYFPNWRDHHKTEKFSSRLSGTSGKKWEKGYPNQCERELAAKHHLIFFSFLHVSKTPVS